MMVKPMTALFLVTGFQKGKALQALTPRNGFTHHVNKGQGHGSSVSALESTKPNGHVNMQPRSLQTTAHNRMSVNSGVIRAGSRNLPDIANTTGVPRYIAHTDPSDVPYQHPLLDEEIVKVDIHGHPRGSCAVG